MRLTRVKLAGFKSFVDPTVVTFPSNLTGVVGPNGCGKSNVIDAVRWVMGELSARHLRGDSMADVIFNGSGSRRPVGTASVELVFDNSDGKLGGTYATYNEVSLKRVVSRDGNSAYFINGARCRRRDITTLFLGTGLGSRSYAIIEQGMISRVIEARNEDMRAFVEEAAGISRYKERRRETEARVADTRENLDRLQDLRDEVDKQIRHLTRQASQARRFQELKNEERRLSAEVLALRLREIDSGAAINDRAMRDSDLRLQQELAEQRSAEAAVEKQREFQVAASDRATEVQGSYYQQAAEVARTEQTLAHTRELRERQRSELAPGARHAGRSHRPAVARRSAGREAALGNRGAGARARRRRSRRKPGAPRNTKRQRRRSAQWQDRWEAFNRELGGTYQTTQVERTRIEQLDDQLRRLAGQFDRLAVERDQLLLKGSGCRTGRPSRRASSWHASPAMRCCANCNPAWHKLQALRAAQHETESALEAARLERERTRAEMVALDALQKAALGDADRDAGPWLNATGLASRPRVAAQIEVDKGWERGVEAVLGEVLEAVHVDSLDAASSGLASLTTGRLMLIEAPQGCGASGGVASSLATHVRGAAGGAAPAVTRGHRRVNAGGAGAPAPAGQRRIAGYAGRHLGGP